MCSERDRADGHDRSDGFNDRSYHRVFSLLLMLLGDDGTDHGKHHEHGDNADDESGVVCVAECGKLTALGNVGHVKGDLISVHGTALTLTDLFGHFKRNRHLEDILESGPVVIAGLGIESGVEGVGAVEDTAVFLDFNRREDMIVFGVKEQQNSFD